MYSAFAFTDWQWWGGLLWFLVAMAVSWVMPGLVISSFLKIKKELLLLVAPAVGISWWAVQAYILGWLQVRWLIPFILLIFVGFAWQQRRKIFPLVWRWQLPIWALGLIVVGVFTQLTPVFLSGVKAADGIVFFFVNIYDGIFHLSLARATMESVPPIQPGAAGMVVTNYHYLSNLALGEISRIWGVPLSHLYFQYLPMVLSGWFGVVLVAVMRQWTNSKVSLLVVLWLFYFSGELTWLLNLLLGGNSTVPFEVIVDHGTVQFLNPPQAFAKIVFFSSLLVWRQFWKDKTWSLVPILALMTASLIGFKVYFGFLAGLGFAAASMLVVGQEFWQAVQTKDIQKFKKTIVVLAGLGILCLVLGAVIYLPANKSAGGLFFASLAWPKLYLGAEKLNWNEWWLRLQVYEAFNNTKALLVWYGLAASVFLVGIFHIRLLGVLASVRQWRGQMSSPELVFLLIPALVCIFLGMNFLQTSGGFNTFNFLVVALVPLNILTALSVGSQKNRVIQLGMVLLIILSAAQTIPLQSHFIKNSVIKRDRQVVSRDHQEVLQFLATQPVGAVAQTLPRHYLDDVTPYLYFFTGQRTYYGGRGILDSHNQPIADRREVLNSLIGGSAVVAAELALEHGIEYLILQPEYPIQELFFAQTLPTATNSAVPHWQTVLHNEEVILLQVVPADSGVSVIDQK